MLTLRSSHHNPQSSKVHPKFIIIIYRVVLEQPLYWVSGLLSEESSLHEQEISSRVVS
ncbi:5882_t:CDS:2 [Dentiscutata heterogama]|uniref:5882_t:CDS:1 n=1 Tax=Dentiscutata heterogama TaxID=1316150 RepID=A0ACA9MCI5_9GLOM|nr:5882_t:CDS:2 [Dentiscutata heterogama]